MKETVIKSIAFVTNVVRDLQGLYMRNYFLILVSLLSLCSVKILASDFEYVSSSNESILDYDETKVLCDVVMNMNSGDTTLGFIKKYANKIPSKSSLYFLREYGTSINCYGRSFIYYVLYKGHDDDIKALFDAGYDVNWIIEDTRGRKMTMLDYLNIMYKEETNEIYKDLIKTKIKRVRRARGKTCVQLKSDICELQ